MFEQTSHTILNVIILIEFLVLSIGAAMASVEATDLKTKPCKAFSGMTKFLHMTFLGGLFYSIGVYVWIANESYNKILEQEDTMWIIIELTIAFALASGVDFAKCCLKHSNFDFDCDNQ